jgi:predicted alpha/beta-fold hydrolase
MDDRHFTPAWWLPGPHLQTVGARFLRQRDGVVSERERIELDDGDFVDLDWAVQVSGGSPASDAPLVLVMHGLEGSSRSEYVLEMQRALARKSLASVALNFRSCSGEPNRLPRFYHAGDTADAAAILDLLRARFPYRPLGAVGYSLGGNVLLKYLGERGRGPAHDTPVTAAVAISPPFDLAAGIVTIERGLSRGYQHYLLRKLQRKVRAKAGVLQDHVDVTALLAARSVREFDSLGTAPLSGFRDWADYYAQASSKQFLPDIRRPTLVIRALDDPFLCKEGLPTRELAGNPLLEGVFPRSGGHVGFVGGSPWAPEFWAERTAAGYLAMKLAGLEPVEA